MDANSFTDCFGVDKSIFIPTLSLTQSPCPQVLKHKTGNRLLNASSMTCGVPSAILVKRKGHIAA